MFVIGRPGSGKTTAANQIIEYVKAKGYSADRFKDYEILYKMYQDESEQSENHNRERKFRGAEYGGFDVLDKAMFDVALEKLEDNVVEDLSLNHKQVITIEFARDDYQYALSKFSLGFLQNAYFLFVDCDLESCIYRIYERIGDAPKPDFHFVSERIMRTYYDKENWNYMTGDFKKDFPMLSEVVAIRNTSTLEEFENGVRRFAEIVVTEAARRENAMVELTAS